MVIKGCLSLQKDHKNPGTDSSLGYTKFDLYGTLFIAKMINQRDVAENSDMSVSDQTTQNDFHHIGSVDLRYNGGPFQAVHLVPQIQRAKFLLLIYLC